MRAGRTKLSALRPEPAARPESPRERLAWWAWLSTPDDELADRLAGQRGAAPPWLARVPWGVAYIAAALLAGGLATAHLWPLNQAPESWRWGAWALAGVFGLHAQAALVHPRRGAWDLVCGLASFCLHLPLAIFSIAGCIGLVAAGLTAKVTESAWDWWSSFGAGMVLAGGVLLLFVPVLMDVVIAAVYQQHVVDPEAFAEGSWIPDVMFAGLLGYGCWLVAVAFGPGPEVLATPLARTVIVLLITLLAQARLLGLLCHVLARFRARSLRWPRWLAPAPLAFESALLHEGASREGWLLAADYLASRNYPGRLLTAAVRRRREQSKRRWWQPRTAALAAIALLRQPSAGARETALECLTALATRQREVLDDAFWAAVPKLLPDPSLRADLCSLVVAQRQSLRWSSTQLWQALRALDWRTAWETAEPAEVRQLLAEALTQRGSPLRARLLCEALAELDAWLASSPPSARELDPDELMTAIQGLLKTVKGLPRPAAGGGFEPGPARPGSEAAAAYALALRLAASEVVLRGAEPTATAAWYASARRFEALPESRRAEFMAPATYHRLWQSVLRVVDDPEERRRQDERYRVALRSVA